MALGFADIKMFLNLLLLWGFFWQWMVEGEEGGLCGGGREGMFT